MSGGFRMAAVSVRGHRVVIGGGRLEAGDTMPPGVGREFPDLAATRAHALANLAGLSAYHAVQVFDSTGRLVASARRKNDGGRSRWVWTPDAS